MLVVATSALADPMRIAQAQPDVLPPHEIVTILRSTGFNPLDRPVRRGPNYVLRATDEGGEMVRVVVDARGGEVLSVTPLATAARGPLPPGTRMGPYEPMPPGYIPPDYGPPGVYQAGPPVVYEFDDPIIYGTRPPAPVPGVAVQGAPLRAPGAPPSQSNIAAVPYEPHVITAPDEGPTGLLPPPPERFPQRAAPPPAKPVKRTATVTPKPKTAPLPKPKPAGSNAAPPAAAPAITAPQAKPSSDPVPN